MARFITYIQKDPFSSACRAGPEGTRPGDGHCWKENESKVTEMTDSPPGVLNSLISPDKILALNIERTVSRAHGIIIDDLLQVTRNRETSPPKQKKITKLWCTVGRGCSL